MHWQDYPRGRVALEGIRSQRVIRFGRHGHAEAWVPRSRSFGRYLVLEVTSRCISAG